MGPSVSRETELSPFVLTGLDVQLVFGWQCLPMKPAAAYLFVVSVLFFVSTAVMF